MSRKQLQSNVILLLIAFIWGLAFVAQSVAMDYIRPFTFNGIRFVIGGLVLLPVIAVMKVFNIGRRECYPPKDRDRIKELFNSMEVKGGILCGIVLFVTSNIQQFGIMYSSPGKAGFITALYILIVPIIGMFLGKKVRVRIWGCVGIALIGIFLLCVTEQLTIEKGDILLILCAIGCSVHILVVDYFSPEANGIIMSCIQFFVCGVLSLIGMGIFEQPSLSDVMRAWQPILYAGVLSTAVAYTLQIICQKNTSPIIASLLMSMESVFAYLGSVVILGQNLTTREAIGSVLVFSAIMIAQLPSKRRIAA